MTAALDGSDLAIVAGAVVIVAFLCYRLLRRSTLWRRVRVGVFVERDPFDDEPESAPEESPTMVLPPPREPD